MKILKVEIIKGVGILTRDLYFKSMPAILMVSPSHLPEFAATKLLLLGSSLNFRVILFLR